MSRERMEQEQIIHINQSRIMCRMGVWKGVGCFRYYTRIEEWGEGIQKMAWDVAR